MYFTHYEKHFKSTYITFGKKKYRILYHLHFLFEPKRNLVTLFLMAYSIEQQCIIWGPRLCHLFISFCLLLKAEILFLTSLRHEIFLGEKWTNCIPWHLLFPQKRIPLKEKFAWPTPNGDEANDPNTCILHT